MSPALTQQGTALVVVPCAPVPQRLYTGRGVWVRLQVLRAVAERRKATTPGTTSIATQTELDGGWMDKEWRSDMTLNKIQWSN